MRKGRERGEGGMRERRETEREVREGRERGERGMRERRETERER